MVTLSKSDAKYALRVRNTTASPQELWLEPLGDRVVLAPDILYEVTATDALEEIDFSADGFTVYGWVIRVCTIDDHGNVQTVWECPTKGDIPREDLTD
jgi:hypothetical protein